MPHHQIKSRFTGAVLFEGEFQSLKLCVIAAMKLGADLRYADLTNANLGSADLGGADLRGANLGSAYLGGADLRGANLRGAKGIPPVPKIENLDGKILDAIEAGGELDMKSWHGPEDHWCGTTHCRAGWAIHEAGKAGKKLQDAVGPEAAGALIYHAAYPDLPTPDFHASDKAALDDIRKRASLASER